MRALRLAFIALLAVPAAAAMPIELDGSSRLMADVGVGAVAPAFEFDVAFRLANDSSVYLKVLPTPGNPVFLNGTVDGQGWWTSVTLIQPDGAAQFVGATNGTSIVQLGNLEAGVTNRLLVTVHAPAAAVTHLASYEAAYALAVQSKGSGQSSGGSLDPSVSLRLTATAVPGADSPETKGSTSSLPAGAWLEYVLPASLGAAVLALVAVRLFQRRRARGGGNA